MTEQKTDCAGYFKRHRMVIKARGKAKEHPCYMECGRQAHDWATRHEYDGSKPHHYIPLCRSCHCQYDCESKSVAAVKGWSVRRERYGPSGVQ